MTVSSRCFSSSVSARRQRLVALVAALVGPLLLTGSAVAVKRPFKFQGKTSQRLRVAFQVPYSFVGLRRFTIDWNAKCTSGATLKSSTGIAGTIPFDLGPRGRGLGWAGGGVYRFTQVNSGYSSSGGRSLTFRVAITNSGRMPSSIEPSGTWRATTTVTDPATGQVIDTCTTGRVTWKAHLV
jgi:hypothetical protein